MSRPNPSTAMAEVIVDELVRNGVTLIVLSPGSRSTALAVAAVSHPRIETRVVTDERSAGFHALGRAKATGHPAAVVCTSGSAVAHYLPAIVEADMSLTPLVVISADRPAELQDIGSNQTIDQEEIFGTKVRRFVQFEAPGADSDLNESWRSSVSGLMAVSLGSGGFAGPVHMNVRFREPTVPVADDGRTVAESYPYPTDGREGGESWMPHARGGAGSVKLPLEEGASVVLVAGEGLYDGERLAEEAHRLNWPVLATAQSGLRGHEVIGRYHQILAEPLPRSLIPDAVLAVGAIGPSDRLEGFVSSVPVELRMDPGGRRLNPSRTASAVMLGDPVDSLQGLRTGADGSFRKAWTAIDSRLADAEELEWPLSGPAVAKALNSIDWSTLVVGSSLAVRDVDAHLRRDGDVIANRGASGIDGFVSTALGVASAEERVVALTGDLSLLHDANGFLCDVVDDLVTIVCDNDGGGLFDLLPQARHAPDFERLFVAPHGRDLRHVAELHGLDYRAPTDVDAMVEAAAEALENGGRTLIHMRIDRETDLAARREVERRYVESLRSTDS